ncbi:MAG: alanine racemase, partial [Chloroflexi bacterium]|nr:alanine racemase [Chloroflexota bacterium]
EFLGRHLTSKADAWIKVDTGYGRTGIAWDRPDEIIRLAKAVQETGSLSFQGLLVHAGHTYHVASKEEILSIYRGSLSMLKQVQQSLVTAGFPETQLSVGDTPSCSLVDGFSCVDEVRPGNFVFYDIKQLSIGSCSEQDLAVGVACPVVAKHQARNEIILYGGAVHLSKDFIVTEDGSKVFGRVCLWEKAGWGPMLSGAYVSSLSQEHGVVKTTAQWFERIQIGDSIVVLPIHSCLLSYLLKEYHTLDGEILSSESAVCTPA